MTCRVDGCNADPKHRKHQLCPRHYSKLRREGLLAPMKANKHEDWARRLCENGYWQIKLPKGHPALETINSGHGRFVWEHRFLLWRVQAGEPKPCVWCHAPLTWSTTNVDHLNFDKADNRIENLVPSCRGCNMGRGAGSNHETWAASIACRRVLRRYAEEYEAERQDVFRLLQMTGQPSTNVINLQRSKAQAIRSAAKAMAA